MSIKLKCRMCGKELEVPDSFAGKKGKCPFCMEVLDIPAAGELPAAEARGDAREGASGSQAGADGAQAPVAESEAMHLAPAGKARSRLRLSVILPGAFVVVGAVILALIMNEMSWFEPKQPDQDTKEPVAHSANPAAGASTDERTHRPAEPPQPKRFPDTQRIAAALPKTVCCYVEIKEPWKFFDQVAALPMWKNKAEADKRCRAARREAVKLIAAALGQKQGPVAEVLRRARTLHLGFFSLNEQPLMVVSLGEQASRKDLFGDLSLIDFVRSVRFDEEADFAVDEFRGENDRNLFVGYHNYCAVLGAGYELVCSTLKRLRTEAADGLRGTEWFQKALAARTSEATWVCLAPEKQPELLHGHKVAALLETEKIRMIEATLDAGENKISGSIAPAGTVANLLAGSGEGITAKYAPDGGVAYASISPGTLDVPMRLIEKVLQKEAEPAHTDVFKNILPALAPEIALVIPDEPDLGEAAIVVGLSDPERLEKALGGHFLSSLIREYKEFKIFRWSKGALFAYGKDAVIIARGQATVRRCIDAATGGKNMSAEVPKKTCATVRADIAAAVAPWVGPLQGGLSAGAFTLLAAEQDGGVVRFRADASGLGVLAAYFSTAVEKRRAEQERLRAEEIRKARAKARENITAISHAINEFVASDFDLLEYPGSIKEVIDAGLLKPELLRHPLDEEPGKTADGIVSSYDFIFERVQRRVSAGFSTKAIIVWERKPYYDGKHMVSFVSGSIKALASDELKKAIDRALKEAKQNAPRRVKIPRK